MDNSIGNDKTIIGRDSELRHSLADGQLFGQYRIVRLLGRGGMGEVYKAEHSTLGVQYALKLLPAEFSSSYDALERFRREAKVMAQLSHPNIIKVDDFGSTDGRYWLRMELAQGVLVKGSRSVSLSELAVRQGGAVPALLLLEILRQLLAGLAHAHGRGVVHRDLKPANILLSGSVDSPAVRIADFGLARLVGEEWLRSRLDASVRLSVSVGVQATQGGSGSSTGASSRALLGTFEYMSPEQKRGEEVDARSDVYAVGVMAYRLLTGRNLSMKRPSNLVAGLDPAWDDFVEKALEENADERYRNASEMLVALESCSQQNYRPVEEMILFPWQVEPQRLAEEQARKKVDAMQQAEARHHSEKNVICREILLGNDVVMELVGCPMGTFFMGSPSGESNRHLDETQHQVTISRLFWLGRTQVTQVQWQAVMGNNPSEFKGDDLPVENISWADAMAFCQKLNRWGKDLLPAGYEYCLPSEAEWEYACRAGSREAYAGTGRLGDMGWYAGNSDNKTHPVAQKQPNAWGLYDMHGNVWEWCQDCFSSYPARAVTDPVCPVVGSSHVYRGGSWNYSANYCRSAYRNYYTPGDQGYYIGFRVALVPSVR